MKRLLVWLVLILPVLPVAASAQTTECDGNFHLVHTLGSLELSDIDFAGPNDGWAVGFDYEVGESGQQIGNERPLVVRFDDDSFEKITPPHDASVGAQLQGVAAIAPDDVHAVGYSYGRRARSDTAAVAFHWNGTEWVQLDLPSPGRETYLRSVSAVAPNDVWAVGEYSTRGWYRGGTLILHYDGSEWSRVPSPAPGRYASLWDVDAVSATEAWAVGYFTGPSGQRNHPLALRWDGTEWKRRRIGLDFPKSQTIFGLDAVSSEDIWAVGAGANGALVLHFDGMGWSKVEFPRTRGSERLNEVAATATDAWAVGHRFVLRPYETVIPLAGWFSDGAWKHVSYEGDKYGDFDAVTLDDAGGAWAVGETFDPGGSDLGDVIEKACAP